jgi:hypothetical protein
MTIDLNCDLGESFGMWEMGADAAMIELASSVNIACGYHAGDADVMRKTVQLAKAREVRIGAHPGYAATNLQSHSGHWLSDAGMRIGNLVIAQSDEKGALPSLFAASQDLPGASYLGPDGPLELRGHPTLVGRTAKASDPEAAKRLWTMSEELTGVHFGLGVAPA